MLYGANHFHITICSRPSILPASLRRGSAGSVLDSDSDVECLSDQLDFLRHKRPFLNLQINFAAPREIRRDRTEEYHEWLLHKVCGRFLADLDSLVVSFCGVAADRDKTSIARRIQKRIDDDSKRSSEILITAASTADLTLVSESETRFVLKRLEQ